MKKVLLASTALVMSAGLAAADVSVGGDGRMGVEDTFSTDDLSFESRIRISFSASGETDGGLSFGGSVRADNSGNGTSGDAGSVFIEGAFGRLSMGDVDGAADAAVGQVDGVGLTGLGDPHQIIYVADVGPDTPGALYEYSFGDFGFFASVDNPNDTADADAWSVGASYSFDNFSVAIGYENADGALDVELGEGSVQYKGSYDEATHFVVGGSASFGGATVKAVFGNGELQDGTDKQDIQQYAVSGSYTVDAITGTAFYRRSEVEDASFEAYGLGVEYDLGGGAALAAGWANGTLKGAPSNNGDGQAYDFGIKFSF